MNNIQWRLSEHVMVNCGEDCDACNYCDECNQNVIAPGPCERCPCGTNLNAAKTVFAGPTGMYCSMTCVKENLEAEILSLQELLADVEVYFEEVDTESIGLAPPKGKPWRVPSMPLQQAIALGEE